MRSAATPVRPATTYRSQELVFNTACQGLFPPQTTIQPYMALVLEVVRVPLQYAAALNLPCVPPQRRRRAGGVGAASWQMCDGGGRAPLRVLNFMILLGNLVRTDDICVAYLSA